MSEQAKASIGNVIWQDLTVSDAEGIRDFYSQVIGWESSPVEMDGYEDHNMLSPDSEQPSAGICHARGTNANLPPVWLIYVLVADVAASAKRCSELGGEVLDGPRLMGAKNFCVIKDPVGAILALYEA